jgi:hypothetical protein
MPGWSWSISAALLAKEDLGGLDALARKGMFASRDEE